MMGIQKADHLMTLTVDLNGVHPAVINAMNYAWKRIINENAYQEGLLGYHVIDNRTSVNRGGMDGLNGISSVYLKPQLHLNMWVLQVIPDLNTYN